MKKPLIIVCITVVAASLITVFTSCRFDMGLIPNSTTASEQFKYETQPPKPSFDTSETNTEPYSESVTDGRKENPSVSESTRSSENPDRTENTTESNEPTASNKPTAEVTSPTQAPTQQATQPSFFPVTPPTTGATEVDLSIHVPSANGRMEVDTSPANKFTVIVCEERKIDVSYLLAVYSVPDSGQNYVFEFSSPSSRTQDDLRRVYLIDANGKITGVAAKKASEKEGISAVENWFCMNVLIKRLLFPAVEKEFS